jgi:hypothetical protein
MAPVQDHDEVVHSHNIFISYAHMDAETNKPHTDRPTAHRLGTWLEGQGQWRLVGSRSVARQCPEAACSKSLES